MGSVAADGAAEARAGLGSRSRGRPAGRGMRLGVALGSTMAKPHAELRIESLSPTASGKAERCVDGCGLSAGADGSVAETA